MFGRKCAACEVLEKEVAFLSEMVNRLLNKLGVPPTIEKPVEEKPDEETLELAELYARGGERRGE